MTTSFSVYPCHAIRFSCPSGAPIFSTTLLLLPPPPPPPPAPPPPLDPPQPAATARAAVTAARAVNRFFMPGSPSPRVHDRRRPPAGCAADPRQGGPAFRARPAPASTTWPGSAAPPRALHPRPA